MHLVRAIWFLGLAAFAACDTAEAPEEAAKLTEGAVKSPPPAVPDTRTTEDIIQQAQTTHDKALALGHGWSTTIGYLESANKLVSSDDTELAKTTALRAAANAQASLDQAQTEQSAWQDRFPK